MMLMTETFTSPEELAMFSSGKTSVVFLVGAHEECESLAEDLKGLIASTEEIVHIEQDAKLFNTMEKPRGYPAIGVWSSKGNLVGYRAQDESIAEFLAYARRFC